MRKKKPYRILEERSKRNHIVIELFKRKKIYSFGLLTSIGDGGIGYPEQGSYQSFFEAKNASLHSILKHHQSPPQKVILRKFRLMEDLNQPLLFYD
jgi:hypothetical protein